MEASIFHFTWFTYQCIFVLLISSLGILTASMLNFLTIFICYFLSNAFKIFTIFFYSIFISLGISLASWETCLFRSVDSPLGICRFPFHFCKGLFFFYFSSEFCPLIFFFLSFALDFNLSVTVPCGLRNLSSLTRYQTHTISSESRES